MKRPSIHELQESRDSWYSQAAGDRRDACLSRRAISGIGVALAGAGVVLVAKGMPEAAIFMPIGAGVAEAFRREAANESASAQILEARADDRQTVINAQIAC
jgi:hypothetical protein